jgi:hypothetical protein
MRTILGILQTISLFLVWGEVSTGMWFGILGAFVLLYLLAITNRNVSPEDGEKVERLWHIISGLSFIISVVATIGLYLFIFIS